MTTPNSSSPETTKGPIFRLLIILVGIGVAVLLSTFFHWSSKFSVRLTTKSIRFETKPSNFNAGLFNGDTPLELTIEGFDRVQAQGDAAGSISNQSGQMTCTFRGIRLTSIDMTHPLQVSIESVDGALRMHLKRQQDSATAPMATFEAVNPQKMSYDGCGETRTKARISPTDWSIFGINDSVVLTLRPAEINEKLDIEKGIYLQPESAVTFELNRESAIVGSQTELQLTQVDRKIPLGEGHLLELHNLRGAQLGIKPGADAMDVEIHGATSRIKVDGSDEAATLGEVVGTQIPLLKPLGLMYSIATIVSAAWEIAKHQKATK